MIIGTFLFYFVLFMVVFSLPNLRNGNKSKIRMKYFAIPALCSVGVVFFSVIKVYFVYKLLVLVFVLVTGLFSYWQWGKEIQRWWS